MSRICLLVGAVLGAVTLSSCAGPDRATAPAVSPPRPIVYGYIDESGAYPNVGAFIVQSHATGRIYPICSGTLISATVFLTAGHCTAYYQSIAADYDVFVTFDSPIPFGVQTSQQTTLYAVSQAITNPGYNQRQSDSGDIGVLLLSRPLRGLTPATLPTAGLLDQLAAQNGLKNARFTAVGYGVQDRVVGGGTPYFTDANPIPRMYAFSGFNSLNGGNIRLSQNAATGNGGTCYGDSGGPNFLPLNGQLILAATTVTGDDVCMSTNVDYRLDTASARLFLGQYVTLP